MQEWDCNGTSAQTFHISPTSGGYFKIINVNSGKGLDIKDVSTLANAVVQQWSYGGGANQQFRFVARGANQFSFHPRLTDMAVDLYYGRPDNGTILVQYPYAGTSNQLWTFDSVGGGPTPPPGTVPVVVQNSCPFNLNVVLTGVGEISLEKDTAGNKVFRNLSPGATYTYYPPRDYPSGRVAAYKTLPTPAAPRELEKAEFTLGLDGGGGQNIYYNLTYVDHLGLPMKIAATGTGSGSTTATGASSSKKTRPRSPANELRSKPSKATTPAACAHWRCSESRHPAARASGLRPALKARHSFPMYATSSGPKPACLPSAAYQPTLRRWPVAFDRRMQKPHFRLNAYGARPPGRSY